MSELRLTINGEGHAFDAPIGVSLATVLRERIGLTGTKVACNEGHCGACTVQVDGVPVLSCITLAHSVRGEVTTIEGLRDHPLVDAFVRADAVQCGFCTPGQVVSAAALVAANPDPTVDEIRHTMAGNICRRGTYPRIEEAILHCARLIRTEKEVEGRFEEVWLVVEEDPHEQWPAGPGAVVGRAAVRKDAPERVRGEARYTADIQLPGMLHAAVLRSPHAHARVKRSTSRRRSPFPASAALRDGILQADTLVDVRGVVPRGVKDHVIGAGTTLAELEAEATIPDVLREACRLAASPQLRSMGSLGGNLMQSTRCWYWRLQYPPPRISASST